MSCKSPFYSRAGKLIGIYGVSILLNPQSPLEDKYLSEDIIESLQFLQYSQFTVESSLPKLTNRQKECLFYLAKGMTLKKIALILKLSPKTVEHYFEIIKAKLNCTSRDELVNKAFEYGLL